MVKENIGHKSRRYFKDIFTTLIDSKWRWTLTVFTMNFLTLWTIFACFWYLMALAKGDIAYYEKWLAAVDKEAFEIEFPRTPCVRHLYSFASAFLFSIETQHTIGRIKKSFIGDKIFKWLFFLFFPRLWFSACYWRVHWWSIFNIGSKVKNLNFFIWNLFNFLIIF